MAEASAAAQRVDIRVVTLMANNTRGEPDELWVWVMMELRL